MRGGVVKRRFDDAWLGAGEQCDGGMDREGAGIVVGMTAFVRVGEDCFGFQKIDDTGDSPGDRRQFKGGLLVGDLGAILRPQRACAGWLAASQPQSSVQFVAAGLAVGVQRVIAMGSGIGPVLRGAVGDGQKLDIGEVVENAAEGQHLVVGVGEDDEQARGEECARLLD